MDPLWKKASEYGEYLRLEHGFGLEDGRMIRFVFHDSDFAHLIGFHKLKDLTRTIGTPSSRVIDPKSIYREILLGHIRMEMLEESCFFREIAERFEAFGKASLESLLSSASIIDFNPDLIRTEMRKVRYLLVKEENRKYLHLALGQEGKPDRCYPVSFFVDSRDYYIAGQKTVRIISRTRTSH
jgi:hypothetical protein